MAQIIAITKCKKCPECGGTGLNEHRDDACPECHGSGEVPNSKAVVFESDDPKKIIERSHELAADLEEGQPTPYQIVGMDSGDLPDIEG